MLSVIRWCHSHIINAEGEGEKILCVHAWVGNKLLSAIVHKKCHKRGIWFKRHSWSYSVLRLWRRGASHVVGHTQKTSAYDFSRGMQEVLLGKSKDSLPFPYPKKFPQTCFHSDSTAFPGPAAIPYNMWNYRGVISNTRMLWVCTSVESNSTHSKKKCMEMFVLEKAHSSVAGLMLYT